METMQNREDLIDRLVSEGRFTEAIGQLTAELVTAVGTDAAVLYFRRGKLYWRIGDRSAATSDYSKASALDPTSPAVKALEQARDIADFFNPDLYNP